METDARYPNFDLCLKLLSLGFPQKRKFQSMYYVRPDTLICIDDLSALKHDGHTDFEDIFGKLVFKPRIEDLLEEAPFLQEFIRMSDGSVFAYSTVEEDPKFIEQTGRQDKYIRANGRTHWEALVNLYIAVKSKDKQINASIAVDSGNKTQGTIIDGPSKA